MDEKLRRIHEDEQNQYSEEMERSKQEGNNILALMIVLFLGAGLSVAFFSNGSKFLATITFFGTFFLIIYLYDKLN